jgi:transposase
MRQEKKQLEWKEGRRRRAWELSQQGWKQKDIAAALGVSKGAVSQWLKRARKEGIEALRRHLASGRPPKLSAEERAQLPGVLAQGAEAFGFRGQVWARGRGDQAAVRGEVSSCPLQPHPTRPQAQCAQAGAVGHPTG